jgi:SAM-dependent methyltransferase
MNCPLCGSAEKVLPAGKYEDPLQNREYLKFECAGCDIGFTAPMANPGAQWYQSYEDAFGYAGKDAVLPGDRLAALKAARTPGRTQKLLDIGCGRGEFLLAARDLGFEVYGVDFDPRRAADARAAGLDGVNNSSVEEFFSSRAPGAAKFEVITFFQFLEHAEDPRGFVRMFRSALAEGGTIVFDVPNRRRFLGGVSGAVDEPPHHLTKWSARGLEKLLLEEGFAEVRVRSDLYPLLSLYENIFWRAVMAARALLGPGRKAAPAAAVGAAKPASLAAAPGLKASLLKAAKIIYLAVFVPLTVVFMFPFAVFLRHTGRGLVLLVTARHGGSGN